MLSGSTITGINNLILGSYTGSGNPISNTGSGFIIISDPLGNVRLNISPTGNVSLGSVSSNTKLGVNGPIALSPPIIVTAAAYTVLDADSSIVFNTAANCNVVMPAAATYPGRILYVKTLAAMSINSTSTNIKPIGSNTGANSILTNTTGKFSMLQSDGVNWITMMNN